MQPPERRKPVAGKATGSLESNRCLAAFDRPDSIANIATFQAAYLSGRYRLAPAVAATVAELAFPTGRPS